MDSIIYQVLHPWHWLTYGQNATAVGVLVAIAGLVGLYNYVRDTRRIMELQEATARANITPILVARSDVEFVPSEVDCPEGADIGLVQRNIVAYEGALTIRNIGAGAALFLTGWCQPVSEKFVWDNPALLEKTTHSQDGIVPLTELVKDETTQVAFCGFKPDSFNQRWVFVVDTIDQTEMRHQLRVLRTPVANGQTEVAVSMAHQEATGRMKARTLKKLLAGRGGSKS